jgi:uncharacterized protein DUF7002
MLPRASRPRKREGSLHVGLDRRKHGGGVKYRMPLDLAAFGRLRPYLYHLTARENLARIRSTRRLESAATLMQRAGRIDLLDMRRREHVAVTVEDETVMLRDQAPLHAGNMQLDPGWSFAQFVRHLNKRVFFWPGVAGGPISYGLRHFGRYEPEAPVIFRVPFSSLVAANPQIELLFCRYNSGSPRWSRGIAAPRGATTFVRAADASFGPAHVVEVTAIDGVQLPNDITQGQLPQGPWSPFF